MSSDDAHRQICKMVPPYRMNMRVQETRDFDLNSTSKKVGDNHFLEKVYIAIYVENY